jgi:predicted PurR-regulated permease PerM
MITQSSLRQFFSVAIMLVLAGLICTHLYFLIDAFLGAIILGIISVKPIRFLVKRKLYPMLAEWLFLISTMIILIVPIVLFLFFLKNKWNLIFKFINQYIHSIEILGQKINEKTGIIIVNQDLLQSTAMTLTSNVPSLFNSSLYFMINLGVMYLLLYFFIKDKASILKGVFSLLPLHHSNRTNLFHLTYQSVLSNALIMPLVALAQALCAWLGFIIIGLENSFIWFIASFFASMLPFFGAGIIFIPLGFFLIIKGSTGNGIFILIWGIALVGTIDNFLRMYFMKRIDHTHPLITFLGVMMGLNLFGFLGIIFGPLLISMLFILIKIYKKEYNS